ncbi:hypothetical protein GCM10025857_09530 [Alicyclobacillus contaminans]|uniref:dynamin family protein n=1 Tax=Alicyclobacillus contaminans TaxID=392016 RepID=UPI0004270934|nr:dynamin family protein [Alicyclobacillus contaminans]GMA49596.1 hypothetical protein GCM10025857_09530 [Alicyclobacillus contaminans]
MTTMVDNSALQQALAALRGTMAEAEQWALANKVADLERRAATGLQDLYVAFCGLFSAGKSSLINALVADADLATGAVPTTAEVTAVRTQVEARGLVLLDTPGVDSTDASHAEATEAALHMADAIIFVMDYQHVESEENIELARAFVDSGKPLYLVINQVDKHIEWELPFSEFQRRVEQTFRDHGLTYERIYYTSTRDAAHDETARLKADLEQLASTGDELVRKSLLLAADTLVRQFVTGEHAPEMAQAEERLYDTIGYVPFDEDEAQALQSDAERELQRLTAQMDAQRTQLRQTLEALGDEVRRQIQLAQIAPYETTEKGRLYVESQRPNFKVGGLFGGQRKTDAERAQRLEAFVRDLSERTEKFLVWPLQGQLRQWLETTAWADEAMRQSVEEIRVPAVSSLCQQTVNSGALMSEQYPYQYVKDVVGQVKSQVQAQVNGLLEAWRAPLEAHAARVTASERTEKEKAEAAHAAVSRWLSVRAAMAAACGQYMAPLRQLLTSQTEPGWNT